MLAQAIVPFRPRPFPHHLRRDWWRPASPTISSTASEYFSDFDDGWTTVILPMNLQGHGCEFNLVTCSS